MQAIRFYSFYFFSWLFAQLPLWVLYGFSNAAAFVMYYFVRYRRATVRQNLANSFPDKALKEIIKIEKRFYIHLADLFVESFFQLHASKKRVKKLCKFNNIELLHKYFDKGNSVIVAAGHYCNWEILALFGEVNKHLTIGIYKPLVNKYYENLLNKGRQKFGGVPVPMQDTFKTAISYHNQGKLFFLGLISDQTPAKRDIHYWVTFMNQETPVFLGVEKIARKLNQPVFFCNVKKVRRGRYEVDLELLCENPLETKPYEITTLHVKALEKLIRQAPEYWLWSHRRWKYKRSDYPNQTLAANG